MSFFSNTVRYWTLSKKKDRNKCSIYIRNFSLFIHRCCSVKLYILEQKYLTWPNWQALSRSIPYMAQVLSEDLLRSLTSFLSSPLGGVGEDAPSNLLSIRAPVLPNNFDESLVPGQSDLKEEDEVTDGLLMDTSGLEVWSLRRAGHSPSEFFQSLLDIWNVFRRA